MRWPASAPFCGRPIRLLSRRFPSVPTSIVTWFCAATSALSLACHFALEETVLPATTGQWLAVLGLGLMPVGAAFYAWDIGVKRGNIQVLGAASYAAPLLSTLILIVAGFAEPTTRILAACVPDHRRSRACREVHAVWPQGGALRRRTAPAPSRHLPDLPGSQPGSASSNWVKSKPGATVQPTSVQSPRLRAVCHQPAGTTACGRSPALRSMPSTSKPCLPPRRTCGFPAAIRHSSARPLQHP